MEGSTPWHIDIDGGVHTLAYRYRYRWRGPLSGEGSRRWGRRRWGNFRGEGGDEGDKGEKKREGVEN